MNDFQQSDDVDVDVTPRRSSGRRHRGRSRLSSLGLVGALVAALVAGPAVASRLASTDRGPAGSYSDLSDVPAEPSLPAPTTTPDNANKREGRTAGPTPSSTGENANQREGRTWGSSCG